MSTSDIRIELIDTSLLIKRLFYISIYTRIHRDEKRLLIEDLENIYDRHNLVLERRSKDKKRYRYSCLMKTTNLQKWSWLIILPRNHKKVYIYVSKQWSTFKMFNISTVISFFLSLIPKHYTVPLLPLLFPHIRVGVWNSRKWVVGVSSPVGPPYMILFSFCLSFFQ